MIILPAHISYVSSWISIQFFGHLREFNIAGQLYPLQVDFQQIFSTFLCIDINSFYKMHLSEYIYYTSFNSLLDFKAQPSRFVEIVVWCEPRTIWAPYLWAVECRFAFPVSSWGLHLDPRGSLLLLVPSQSCFLPPHLWTGWQLHLQSRGALVRDI